MTKMFISQPMNGFTDEEIKANRRDCESWLTKIFEEAEIVDSFFLDEPPRDCKNPGLWYLGESLKALSKADVLVQWGDCASAKGCTIEKYAATIYGLPVIKDGGKYD